MGSRSIPAYATAWTAKTSPPCSPQSSTAWRSSAAPAGAAISARPCWNSAGGSPWLRFSTPTPCWSSSSNPTPTWAGCCSICAGTGRRSPASSERERPTASPRHLLLVDDEPHIGLVLRPVLEGQGFEVSLARTLAQARAALADPTAAITGLLLDLHPPDGSGLGLPFRLPAP